MLKIEKTVFISYRRTNAYHARAIFMELRNHGYDVFLDYEGIDSGAFDQVILNQIKARAHFIVILTPSALERCHEPNDWLRREIETAIEYKRNIIPLMFDGFNWGNMGKYLVGQMSVLSTYNALEVPMNYFDAAMERLRMRFLNVAIDAVTHPAPEVDKTTIAQKIADIIAIPLVTAVQLRASQFFEKGYQHSKAGEYDEAIEDYTQAISINPKDPIFYHNRGNAYFSKGDFKKAIADFTEAISYNPLYADAYANRGIIHNKKMDYTRAIAD
ncbi:MAG TPA: tetratricopeptide repeat protein, partial [Aggregatilineales bacterium]|nr:tetratricopeptide repeat protein [Aggregatilineales bacterium]